MAEVPSLYCALNKFVSAHIHMLDGALCFLLRRPGLLDLPNKRQWLAHCVTVQGLRRSELSWAEASVTETLQAGAPAGLHSLPLHICAFTTL